METARVVQQVLAELPENVLVPQHSRWSGRHCWSARQAGPRMCECADALCCKLGWKDGLPGDLLEATSRDGTVGQLSVSSH